MKHREIAIIIFAGLINSLMPGCSKENEKHTELPSVITRPISNITLTRAKVGGKVYNEGDSPVTDRGVVWSTSPDPTVFADDKMSRGKGAGEFTMTLFNLQPYTLYFLRAYAINSAGVAYGKEFTFSTEVVKKPGEGITDIDGNKYKTVIIGRQEWMAENLRATRYSDGTPIKTGIWDYNYDPANSKNYGKLYSWYTAMNSASSSNNNPSSFQGVCPVGWVLPGYSEWEEMIDYLMSEYDLTNRTDDSEGLGNALKAARQVGHPLGGEHDTDEHPRWDQNDLHFGTNVFGFSALPGGFRNSTGDYLYLGLRGSWWSASETTSSNAWRMHLREDYGSFFYHSSRKNLGYSVRCVRVVE